MHLEKFPKPPKDAKPFVKFEPITVNCGLCGADVVLHWNSATMVRHSRERGWCAGQDQNRLPKFVDTDRNV